eukprot:328837_1
MMTAFSNKIIVFVVSLLMVTSIVLGIDCDYFEYSYDKSKFETSPAIPCNLCLTVQNIETNQTFSYKYECNKNNNTVHVNTYMDNKCHIFLATQSFNAYIHTNNNVSSNNICEYKLFKLFANETKDIFCNDQNEYGYFEFALVSQCYRPIIDRDDGFSCKLDSADCNTIIFRYFETSDCTGLGDWLYTCKIDSSFPFNVSNKWTNDIVPICVENSTLGLSFLYVVIPIVILLFIICVPWQRCRAGPYKPFLCKCHIPLELTDSNPSFVFDSNEYKVTEQEIVDLKLKPELSNKYYKIKIDENKKIKYFKYWKLYSCYCCDCEHEKKSQIQKQVVITDKELIILKEGEEEAEHIPFEHIVKIGRTRKDCVLSYFNLETIYFEILKDIFSPYLGNKFYYLHSVSPHPQHIANLIYSNEHCQHFTHRPMKKLVGCPLSIQIPLLFIYSFILSLLFYVSVLYTYNVQNKMFIGHILSILCGVNVFVYIMLIIRNGR